MPSHIATSFRPSAPDVPDVAAKAATGPAPLAPGKRTPVQPCADVEPAERNAGFTNLFMVRCALGYRTAKAFAEALGISASSYRRYESDETGPGMKAPVDALWRIADASGCTIDELVGRTPLDPHALDFQRFHDSASEEARTLLAAVASYVCKHEPDVEAPSDVRALELDLSVGRAKRNPGKRLKRKAIAEGGER